MRIALMDFPPSSIVSANTVVQDRLWLPNLAPQATLGLGGAFALACIIGATLLATRQPSLGITWEAVAGKPGLVVAVVTDRTKHPLLTTGDRILAIRLPGEAPINLENELILEDPDIHPTYAGYNRFFEQQSLVAAALAAAKH
jgi:hypothetical protein